jgi:AcrR family transcriptional regulator
MPKKLMATREDLRTAMIDTAERLIALHGVAALTARRLAGEMGIAVGTTYNFFKQMDDLISEVNARTLAALASEIEAVGKSNDEPEQMLMDYADCYIEFVNGHSNLWAALFVGAIDVESEVQERNTALVHRMFDVLEKALTPLYVTDPNGSAAAKSARALWAAVHGVLSLTSGGRDKVLGFGDIRGTVRLLVHYHVAGVQSGS